MLWEGKGFSTLILTNIWMLNGELPFEYIEETMHHRRLPNKDRKVVEERLKKNKATRKEKMLTTGGSFSPHKVLTI